MSHDFHKSLALSHKYSDAPWWMAVYKLAFPNLLKAVDIRDDGWAQRGGIDRQLILKSGKVISIDEKVRLKDWGDILLERWSDQRQKTPGWVQKDLACDYIAYAFVPSQRCYMLPFQQLRKAWLTNGRKWIMKASQKADGFKTVLADNDKYVTESIAVPTGILMKSIQDAMIIEWGMGLASETYDKKLG
jgi:hypothetical protein